MAGAKTAPTVVGTFSKAVKGSISLNYSEGADENCDDSCPLKEKDCYTKIVQSMKPSVRVSGERKRKMGFEAVIAAQYWKVKGMLDKGKAIPWARFSSFGSIPNRKLTGVEKTYLRILVLLLIDNDIRVHLPVETESKREQLQMALSDLPVAIRVSAHGDDTVKGPISMTVGDFSMKRSERLVAAHKVRKSYKGTAVVCPAISSTFKKTKAIKCGSCTACAQSNIKLIIYPIH